MLTVVWIKSHGISSGLTGCVWITFPITLEWSQLSVEFQVALPPLTAN
jgi:hypothetical protein